MVWSPWKYDYYIHTWVVYEVGRYVHTNYGTWAETETAAREGRQRPRESPIINDTREIIHHQNLEIHVSAPK